MALTYLKTETISGIGTLTGTVALAYGAGWFYIVSQSGVRAVDGSTFAAVASTDFSMSPVGADPNEYVGATIYGQNLYALQSDSRYDFAAAQLRSALIRSFRLSDGNAGTPLAVHVGIDSPLPPIAGLLFDGETFNYLGVRNGAVNAISARITEADEGRDTAIAERVLIQEVSTSPYDGTGEGHLIDADNRWYLLDVASLQLLAFDVGWIRDTSEDVALHTNNAQPIGAIWDGASVVVLDGTGSLFFYGGAAPTQPTVDRKQQWSSFDSMALAIQIDRRNPDNTLTSIESDLLSLTTFGVVPAHVTDPIAIDRLQREATFTPKFTVPSARVGDLVTVGDQIYTITRFAAWGNTHQVIYCEIEA